MAGVKSPHFQLNDLEILVDELTCSKPNQKKVKDLMTAQGLKYVADPLQQMSTVLDVMNKIGKVSSQSKQKEIDA